MRQDIACDTGYWLKHPHIHLNLALELRRCYWWTLWIGTLRVSQYGSWERTMQQCPSSQYAVCAASWCYTNRNATQFPACHCSSVALFCAKRYAVAPPQSVCRLGGVKLDLVSRKLSAKSRHATLTSDRYPREPGLALLPSRRSAIERCSQNAPHSALPMRTSQIKHAFLELVM
ncbi:hypothetical protein EJ03DRAFT_50594 [Teratosphaeria nubilosa]|uniref:Uncharacterized protein n=1 Tax=Teratosphaeria nubilosa TaxID=161662 RepID=A0A6G1LDA7_9PEZI|nr:hypothetical protein EJ03DRAFT_50594 [Teratosphaeria nubilosa]